MNVKIIYYKEVVEALEVSDMKVADDRARNIIRQNEQEGVNCFLHSISHEKETE
jgi:hypothetical protein